MTLTIAQLSAVHDKLPTLPKGERPGYFIIGITPVLASLDDEDLPNTVYRFDSKQGVFVSDLSMSMDIMFSHDTRRVSVEEFTKAVHDLSN
ncbi:MAG: hypothetical protein AAF213_03010 [Pseudomonadota bacterium]